MSRGVSFPLISVILIWSAGCGPGASGGLSALSPVLARIEQERVAAASTPAGRAAHRRGADSRLRQTSGWKSKQAGLPAQADSTFSLAGFRRQALTQPGEHAGAEQTTRETRPADGPLPGFWDTVKRDVRRMPGDLWTDAKAVYTSPTNLLILGLTYGGSLAIQQTGPDDTVENSFDRGHRTFKNDWRDGFAAAGNPGTHFALAGLWYLIGQQRQDEKTYEVSKTLFSALAINGLSTLAGKAATWDDGPNGEWGAFPSGHTSSSFTFASVMDRAYGPWVGVPLYALSVLVAYERVESGEHYLSDVVMGGVLGLVIGHTVAGEHEFKLFGGEIVPYVDPYSQTSGLAWVKHFK
ncbi:MAG: phosphatase PAP2 family protein [Planctomycetota bacterium]